MALFWLSTTVCDFWELCVTSLAATFYRKSLAGFAHMNPDHPRKLGGTIKLRSCPLVEGHRSKQFEAYLIGFHK
jgi:hypothetical protein